MNRRIDPGFSRETWSARYEQLRTRWIHQESSWGQALFLRQGLVAWMTAWPLEPPSQTPQEDERLETISSQPMMAISSEWQRQLTRELAHLMFHCQQEVLV